MDQADRIRAMAYEKLAADPSGPNAPRLREILSSLPKVQRTRDPFGDESRKTTKGHKPVETAANLHSGEDFGVELPPTPDEEAGLPNELATPGIGTRALTTVSDPHTRREFERGVDDMVAFGAGQKLAGLAEKISPTPGEGGFTPEGAALDASRAPNARGAGQIVGAIAPGGTRYLGGGISRATNALVRPLTSSGIPGSVFGGILSGAAANTLTMPVIAGAQAGVRGENPLPAAAEEIKNPLNPIVGGAIGAPVGLARGIRGSNTQTGRDIRLAEDYGADVGPFRGASGGAFEAPPLKGAEESTRGAGIVATKASREVLKGLAGEQTALSAEYNAAKTAAGEAGFLEGRVRPDYVVDEANRLLSSKRLTAPQKAQIQKEVNDVLAESPNGMTVDDFNDFRAKLADMADFGEQGAANHPALGDLFSAAKNAIDETEMGPINRVYHEGKEALRVKRGKLKITEKTNPRTAEDRIAGEILRRGENTPTSGIQDTAIEEFLQENPQYRHLFDSVSLLNAKERMGAGVMSHGGSLYTRIHGLLEHNLEPMAVGAYRVGSSLQDKGVAATLAAKLLTGGQ